MNTLPSEELIITVLGLASFAGMIVGLIAALVTVTIGFRKVVEVEKLVAPQGSELYKMARLVGDHLVGRMIRGVALTSFLVQRRFPGWGVKRAEKWGNVDAEVPLRLRRWILIPQAVAWGAVTMMFLCGGLAKWLDTGAVFS